MVVDYTPAFHNYQANQDVWAGAILVSPIWYLRCLQLIPWGQTYPRVFRNPQIQPVVPFEESPPGLASYAVWAWTINI
jgi:hypothetical protein